jgi:ligand-binding sensor domain-containing protein
MNKASSVAVSSLALFFLVRPAGALDPGRRISQYAHTAWRMQDGAFSGTPHAITQTSDGFVWIGTDAGLVKFDGVRFLPWDPPEGKRLASSNIYSLLGGSDGTLWIGSSAGLTSLKANNLVDFSNARGRINAILEDHTGKIWVARSRPRGPTGGICQVVGEELRCFGNSNGMALAYAQSLAEDNLGNLWIGSANQLMRWKSGLWNSYFREELRQYEGLSGVEALAAGEDRSLWVGFDKKGLGLQRLVQGVRKAPVLPRFDPSQLQVFALFIDRDNSLWIGTGDDGIYRVRAGEVDHFRSEDGLSSNAVADIHQDREGSIWLVTSKGVDVFRDNRVASLSIREGLTTDEVQSVLAARDGTVWIGNRDALDFLRMSKLSAIRKQNGLPGHRVTSLCEDRAGRLWIGADDMLTIYQRGQFRPIDRPNGTPLGIVTAITEDTDRNIWVSVTGKDRRLFRIQDLHVREEFTPAQIPYARVLAADPAGGVWLGLLNGGLARYRSSKFEIFPLNHSSLDASVEGLFVDSDSSVWVATREGLSRWKEGTLKTLTSKNGLECDEIFAAVRDNENMLWLYAKCGIIAIADSELERWWRQPDTMVQTRILDVFDGAQPSLTTFQPAVSKSPDGRLWFANDTVLQVVDPHHLNENRVPPPVQIEQVVADRKSYSTRKNLQLPPRTRDIEIDYTALSFAIPQKVRFRYKLDGRDGDWQEPGTRRQAFYSDLPPGQYRFHVTACNNDGLWNEAGAALNFSVAPAYYQAFWFRLLCVGLGVAVLWVVYWLRVRQIAAGINARFDERLAERTRLARDFHDTLLQTIQGSKLVADDALEEHVDPIRMRNALERLSGWLGQAIEEGRSALNSLRSSTTQRNDLAEALRRAGEECLCQRSIEFGLSVEGAAREMHPVVRDEVYRIGYEAIRNACAHSEASRLSVDLSYMENLTLRVRDNGKGIDPDVAAEGKGGHFGLIGMYERASRVRGKLTLSSSPGVGTEVELVVPRKIAFQQPNPIRSRFEKIRRLF